MLRGDTNGVSLNYLSKNTDGFFFNLEEFIISVRKLPNQMLEYIVEGTTAYEETLKSKKLIVSNDWDGGKNLFVFLYTYVRAIKPKLIVETGVANGISTNAIMKALIANQESGTLYSFDTLSRTKQSYSGSGNWNFVHLKKPYSVNLFNTIKNLEPIDLWLHDSNHGYPWQKTEYAMALSKLSEHGALVSDDIDASVAWRQFAAKRLKESYILNDSKKFIGIGFKYK